MPMSREDYEELLGKLNNAELPHSERTELLQTLRADYSNVIGDHEKMSADIEKIQKDNADLVLSNSKLFREVGLKSDPKDTEPDEKEFSETVTVSQLLEGK